MSVEDAMLSDVYVGPIRHDPGLCRKVPCDCWCMVCERHNAVPSEARATAVAPYRDALDWLARFLDYYLTGDPAFNEATVRYEIREARALLSAPSPVREPELTHGRHCPCSACAREDWTNPRLGPCGMHGPDCPRVYARLASERPADEVDG